MVDCCKQNEDGKYEMLSREEITEKSLGSFRSVIN